MKLNRRELLLGWITAAVVLIALTSWWLQPRLQAWREAQRQRQQLHQRRQEAEYLIARRGAIASDLEEIRRALPSHPAGRNVTADFLRLLESRAQQHGIILQRREAGRERQIDDLFEVSIQGGWEGTLAGLVDFLYALQEEGVTLDVDQLTVTPDGATGRLRGLYAVQFAYTRTQGTDAAPDNGRRE